MPKFLFVYHGGSTPETPEAADAMMTAWTDWMAEVGDAWDDAGFPVLQSSTVSAAGIVNDGGPNPAMGISTVIAADMAAALKIASGCPVIADGGSVEVAEEMQL